MRWDEMLGAEVGMYLKKMKIEWYIYSFCIYFVLWGGGWYGMFWVCGMRCEM